MTSPPPEAAGPSGSVPSTAVSTAEAVDAPAARAASSSAASSRPDEPQRTGPARGQRSLPPVRPSSAPVELTLDLSFTPPDKVLSRLLGALERVDKDVTLYVLLRDTPEYVGVTSSAYQLLRAHGYVSDSMRVPNGRQRLRVQSRRGSPRPGMSLQEEPEAPYAPHPSSDEPESIDWRN
ncbi:MAG: hypothetical protein HY332_20210 [Chloroflexi bacterium]|nr:hypothetical protein [Chloroflexota bacterium]